jgi:tetratricopeptide (TPR) repeat protein
MGSIELDASLTLEPKTEVRRLAALTLINKGDTLARLVDIKGAVAMFQQALQLYPTRKLNPEVEARKVAAQTLSRRSQGLLQEGKVHEAAITYAKARSFDPNLKVSASSRDALIAACEKAVTFNPEREAFRDSRGITRALAGNIEGAIEDFQAYIAWTDNDEWKLQRQRWIDALKAGENPFTSEEIETLFNQ